MVNANIRSILQKPLHTLVKALKYTVPVRVAFSAVRIGSQGLQLMRTVVGASIYASRIHVHPKWCI
jgi:hypothetical protein